MRKFKRLQELLWNVNGSTFLGLDTETAVTLRGGKKNPFQGRVTKQTTGSNVIIFTNANSNGYENMVRRRLLQENKDPESFQLSPRKWGERITGTPFVQHNDRIYIEVIFLRAGTVKYFVDGVETDKNTIDGLEDKEEGEQGGLDNKVIIRTYAVDSIKRISINRETFLL